MDAPCTTPQTTSRPERLHCLTLLCLWLIAPVASAVTPEDCTAGAETEAATVNYVVDGDTLGLSDGRRIRVIGLNAPELQPEPQPWAIDALKRVRELIASSDNRVLLIADAEKFDRHGRHLYHVMLNDRQLVAGRLIKEGLAVQVSVAPNTLCATQYAGDEQTARDTGRGLWADDDFWRVSFKRLSARTAGFRFVQDRVQDIKTGRSGIQLMLKHGLVIDIDPSITLLSASGETIKPAHLLNQMVEVRGWLYRYRKQHHLRLHHTANFQLLKP